MKFLSNHVGKARTRLVVSLLLVGFLLSFGLGAPQPVQAEGLIDNALEDILAWLLDPVGKTLSEFSDALLPQEVRVPFVFSGALPLTRAQDVICNYVAYLGNCDLADYADPGKTWRDQANYVQNPSRDFVTAPVIRGGLAVLLTGLKSGGQTAGYWFLPQGDKDLRRETLERSNPDLAVGSTGDSKIKALPLQASDTIKRQRNNLPTDGSLDKLHAITNSAAGLALYAPRVAPRLYENITYNPQDGPSLQDDGVHDYKEEPEAWIRWYLGQAGNLAADQVHRVDTVAAAVVAERNEINRIDENAGNRHSGGLVYKNPEVPQGPGDVVNTNLDNPDSINAHFVRASDTGGGGSSGGTQALLTVQSRRVAGLRLTPAAYAAGLKAALQVAQ